MTDAGFIELGAKLTKAEDSPAQSGHPGVPILGQRNDGRAVRTSTDGDYGFIAIDSAGRVAVNVDGGSITGTFTAAAEHNEDVAHASGDTGSFALAVRRDAESSMAADGDYHALEVDSVGRLKVNATGTVAVTDGGGSITVDGAATAADIVALDTSLNVHLENLTDWSVANRCSVSPISGSNGVQGGSGAVSASTQRVVLATDVALPAGTNAIGKLAANSGVDIGDVDVTSLPAVEAGYVPGTLAFGSINGSAGAYVTLITMSGTCKNLTIFNTTNQDITVSFDASTIHGYVPSRGSWTVDYQANLLKESSNVSVRYATTTAGVSGAVFGNAVT